MFGTGQAGTGTWWKQGNTRPSPGAELVGWKSCLGLQLFITLQTGFYQEQRHDLGQISAKGSMGRGAQRRARRRAHVPKMSTRPQHLGRHTPCRYW